MCTSPSPSLLSTQTHSPRCSIKQEMLWKINSQSSESRRLDEIEDDWGSSRRSELEAGGTSNCCLKILYARSMLTPQPSSRSEHPPLPLLLFWICPLISIPDLSSRHLQPVCSTNQRPDIARCSPLSLILFTLSVCLSVFLFFSTCFL